MKKILFVVLATCLTSLSVKAQISSFNIAEKKAFVYLGWTPSWYDYNEGTRAWARQSNDWLEVGAHYPIWKGLNINAGISMNVNFKSIEDFGFEYTPESELVDDDGYLQESYDMYGEGLQLRGAVLNAGVSYSIGKGSFRVIPGLGLLIGQGWDAGYWPSYYPEFEDYATEELIGTKFGPNLSLDIAYKNIIVGLQTTPLYSYNYASGTLKIGYGFPLKNQSKMNF